MKIGRPYIKDCPTTWLLPKDALWIFKKCSKNSAGAVNRLWMTQLSITQEVNPKQTANNEHRRNTFLEDWPKYFQQESIQIGCVPHICQLYVLWRPPLGVSTGAWVCAEVAVGIPTQPSPPLHTPIRHRHTLDISIPPTYPSPGHIHPSLGRNLGPGISNPLWKGPGTRHAHPPANRHIPVKALPSYCCGL